MNGDQAIAQILDEWLPMWAPAGRESVDPGQWDIGGATLPPLTLEALQEACWSCPAGAGLGWGQFRPKWILRLPLDYQQRFLSILQGFEDIPGWFRDLVNKHCLRTLKIGVAAIHLPRVGVRPPHGFLAGQRPDDDAREGRLDPQPAGGALPLHGHGQCRGFAGLQEVILACSALRPVRAVFGTST